MMNYPSPTNFSLDQNSSADTPMPAYPETPMTQALPPELNKTTNQPSPKKKSPLLIIGLLAICLVVGLAAWLARNSQPKKNSVTITPPPQVTQPSPTPLFLTLDAVDSGAVVGSAGEVLITGGTLPQSAVVIFSDQDEVSVTSDDQGKFEETVMVDPAGGEVTVVAFSEAGDEMAQIIQVTPESPVLGKSDEKPLPAQNNARNMERLEKVQQKTVRGLPSEEPPTLESVEPESAPTPTSLTPVEETKKIREFVQERNQVKINLKIGKDKIKSMVSNNGLSLQTGTESGRVVKSTPTKQSPVQIFQVKLLSGKPIKVQKRHAVSGIITQINGSEIVIANPNQSDRTYILYTNPETVVKNREAVISTQELAVGNRVAAVGEPVTGGLLTSRIHLIPGKATGLIKRQPTTMITPTGVSPTPLATPSILTSPEPTATTTITQAPTASPTTEPNL